MAAGTLRPSLAGIALSLVCASTAFAENLLVDGSGFETGPDGWDVLAGRFIQNPLNPATEYADVAVLAGAELDTVPEGNTMLAVQGDSWMQRQTLRWPMVSLAPNTDYTFSVMVKGVIEGQPVEGCPGLGIYSELRVSNGDSNALTNSTMRMVSGTVASCWSQLVFQFNTGDIPAQLLHPESRYSFKLNFDSTKQSWSNEHPYQILVDAVQLEQGSAATPYQPAGGYDIGIDAMETVVGDPMDERALRYYKLFEQSEPLNFRYWVHATFGNPRPGPIGYRVVDAYRLNDSGRPEILIHHVFLPDPQDGIGTFEVPSEPLATGSGVYKLVVAAPTKGESEELIFGILKPQSPYMLADPDQIAFGAQVPNFRYLHMGRNFDGLDSNDLPECEGVSKGTPRCTTKRLFVMGPDPGITFTILKRLGIHHVRIKHVFVPVGYAPTDSIDGEWNLIQTRWFAETADQYDMGVNAMLGDDISEVEDLSNSAAVGYPEWMSPEAIEGPEGWDAFFEGNLQAYIKLTQSLPGLVEGWEAFNEPTSHRNNIPINRLIQLDSLATTIFHARDPGSKVVGFGLTGMSPRGLMYTEWFPQGRDALFGEFIRAGGLNHMDAASIRFGNTVEIETYPDSAYTHGLAMRLAYCGRALHTEVNRLIDAYDPDHSGFPFWVTETNYMSGSGYQKYNVVNAADYGSEGRRVDSHREVARLVSQMLANSMAIGVERVFYFSFENAEFSGIFNAPYRSLTDVYNSPRAALLAYYNVVRFLSGAKLVAQSYPESQRVYLFFENDTEDIVVVFHPDPSMPEVPFDIREPALIYDMWGNRLARPIMGTEPVFFVGRGIDPLAFVEDVEEQLSAPRIMAPPGPTLRFPNLPTVSPKRWDFECSAHMWLSYDNDLWGRNINPGRRFGDTTREGVIISGEYSFGYNDDLVGAPTAIHSDLTVMSGLELETDYRYLKQQLVAPAGMLREYLVIKDRQETQQGTFLLATNDDNVSSDPRYRIADFELAWADPIEARLNVPLHSVDLVELLTENGFTVDDDTEYLLDIVLYAMDDNTEIGLDNVSFTATP